MKIERNISATLRKELSKRGIRFQDFARELGIPRTTLTGYMKGTSHPRADSLEYLAEKLGISLSELVSGDGSPHSDGLPCIEPVLMEIPALHPRAIPIARDAASLLQDAFRLSDDLYVSVKYYSESQSEMDAVKQRVKGETRSRHAASSLFLREKLFIFRTIQCRRLRQRSRSQK